MRVVGNDAESGISSILFHDAAEGHLCRGGHGIGFVEDNEFEGGDGICGCSRVGDCGEYLFCAYFTLL